MVNDGAGRLKNGQLGQSGVRAIDQALARHKEQLGTKRERRE
jgi:hypothetical protein